MTIGKSKMLNEFFKSQLILSKTTEFVIQRNDRQLESYKKFEVLYDTINLRIYAAQYNQIVFIFRRVIFITVCLYRNDSYAQTATFIVCSIIASLFLAAVNPYEELYKNRLELFNEFVVFFCGVLQIAICAISFPASAYYDSTSVTLLAIDALSYFIIAVVMFMLAINLGLTLKDIGRQLIIDLKRRYALWKALKKMHRKK
jgi:hypothetical protein